MLNAVQNPCLSSKKNNVRLRIPELSCRLSDTLHPVPSRRHDDVNESGDNFQVLKVLSSKTKAAFEMRQLLGNRGKNRQFEQSGLEREAVLQNLMDLPVHVHH